MPQTVEGVMGTFWLLVLTLMMFDGSTRIEGPTMPVDWSNHSTIFRFETASECLAARIALEKRFVNSGPTVGLRGREGDGTPRHAYSNGIYLMGYGTKYDWSVFGKTAYDKRDLQALTSLWYIDFAKLTPLVARVDAASEDSRISVYKEVFEEMKDHWLRQINSPRLVSVDCLEVG